MKRGNTMRKLIQGTLVLAASLCVLAFQVSAAAAPGGSDSGAEQRVDVQVELFQEGSFDTVFSEPSYGIDLYASSSSTVEDKVYDLICTGLKNRAATISLSSVSLAFNDDDEALLLRAFQRAVNDNPDLFYVVSNFGYSGSSSKITTLTPTYSSAYTAADTVKYQAAVSAALELVDRSMSDLEKALVLHDYLVTTCAYNWDVATGKSISDDSSAYTAYGALVNHDAVCQGYALAYKQLLSEVGIPCTMASSDSMNHAWNLISLNGKWYHVDATWDDPTPDCEGMVYHTYFLQSDSTMQAKDHYGWSASVQCSDTTYESGYAFNDAVSALHWWNNMYYYVEPSRYSGVIYRVGSSLRGASQWKDLEDQWYTGTVWLKGDLYYVATETSSSLQIMRCDLTTGDVAAVSNSVSYTKAASPDGSYASGYDSVGLRQSGKKIEAVSSTRRTVLTSTDVRDYPVAWDQKTLQSGESAGLAGIVYDADDSQITAGVLENSTMGSATAWAAFYKNGQMVGLQAVSVAGKAGLQAVQFGCRDLPQWDTVRVFLTTSTANAPCCASEVLTP
jgi:hypothetical protein